MPPRQRQPVPRVPIPLVNESGEEFEEVADDASDSWGSDNSQEALENLNAEAELDAELAHLSGPEVTKEMLYLVRPEHLLP